MQEASRKVGCTPSRLRAMHRWCSSEQRRSRREGLTQGGESPSSISIRATNVIIYGAEHGGFVGRCRHVGVDSQTKLIHSVTRVWGDQAYRGQRKAIRDKARRAADFTNRRYRHCGVVDELEKAKNKTKSSVRAKVEHVFAVIKLKFGFTKARYKGLDKNAHRLFVTCALANLFMARRHLLRLAQP